MEQNELRKLSKLCRIRLSEEEEKAILSDLQKVLAYVELLKEVPTNGVKACSHVLRGMLFNVMRSDEPGDLLSKEKFLSNAPDQIGGMIRVPPILKESHS
jgi:aspartyl-tRNA(Asn)/glutamyl-tRNA(Gln) amidotransferase subunit C